MNAFDAARAFLHEDPEPSSREILSALLNRAESGDESARAELDDRFAGSLEFGTAGLRGAIGPGTARMNRVTVMKATWGLGRYLLDSHPDLDAKRRGVVIGFDGRRYSRQFAQDAARVLAGLGIKTQVFDEVAATPLTAFAVTALGAAAGIMVTASHNPPADNGYKVYWANGAQIIPPLDGGIAAAIAKAPRVDDMERPAWLDAAARGLITSVDDGVTASYLEEVAKSAVHPLPGARYPKTVASEAAVPASYADAPLKVVYTAMHGVGHRLVARALNNAGLHTMVAVAAQTEPDPAFPTVAFPNPEEKGALDLAFALAEESHADLVIANDPDADRLAVALRSPSSGRFERLSGNDVGMLLGLDALRFYDVGEKRKLVSTTVVSSSALSRIAKNLGADYDETLTGFKWIANRAIAAEKGGEVAFIFGYEEALGYTWGPLVRDKDGVSAVVRLAELAAWLKCQGKTLHDALDELVVAHGLSADLQWSVTLPGREGLARIGAAMKSLRANPLETIAGEKVVRVRDFETGIDRGADGETKLEAPKSDVLTWWTDEGIRLTARPSGTEPKIKFYLEATSDVGDKGALASVRSALSERLARAKKELMERLGL